MNDDDTERTLLLLRLDAMPDPGNVLTWLVDGRPPTGNEVRLLQGLTVQDALRYSALLELDAGLEAAINDERWGGGR